MRAKKIIQNDKSSFPENTRGLIEFSMRYKTRGPKGPWVAHLRKR